MNYRAHHLSISHLYHLKTKNILLSVGKDEEKEIDLKIWDLNKIGKFFNYFYLLDKKYTLFSNFFFLIISSSNHQRNGIIKFQNSSLISFSHTYSLFYQKKNKS